MISAQSAPDQQLEITKGQERGLQHQKYNLEFLEQPTDERPGVNVNLGRLIETNST